MRSIPALLLALVVSPICRAQQPYARPEILIVGTYHMANPGQDIYNMHADDVLSPKRQQEIAEVIAVLKKFRPTKIAIEADVWSKRPGQQYSEYLGGRYTLTRNEIDQIGYRLAKELGHRTVYPVDVEGDFPIQRVTNFAKANGRAEKFGSLMMLAGEIVKEQDEYLYTHTVLQTLQYMNSDTMSERGVAFYYGLIPYGEPGDYAGPDLLTLWYQRNIRIYNNIARLIDSPNDRILVIYGAGHLGWLRQNILNDSTVRLRKLADFIGKP